MASFINDIKIKLKQKDILIQLIVINLITFLSITLIRIVSKLFNITGFDITEYVSVHSNIKLFAHRAWTLITYMFVHTEVFHILFNMLMLYWFGQIFRNYFSSRNLGSLYILGGLFGAALYLLAFNTIPYYVNMGDSLLLGASASVMAIIFASAFYRPEQKIGLLIFGQIKIIYLVLFILIVDLVALANDTNSGGHIAHLGGALAGYLFAKQYRNGRDITGWVSKILDWMSNIGKGRKKAKPKAKFKKRESDYEFNARRNHETEEIDRILDKIKSSGYTSLSKDEKKRLFDASKK